ncbi:leucine-rich repeat domain-containing protein [Listeria newyorkensis]|uniref:leucine-rich repeat domain-containing protein n=1 Tax=Listeria newyorkensis TaxID=1497681 RepID=UPI0010F850F7|nr:leucine-rich repeat domain-containing protein [Listeria newyorkensis]
MTNKIKKCIVLLTLPFLLLSGFQLPAVGAEQEYVIADLFPDPILAEIIATGLKKEKTDLVTKNQLSKFGSLVIKNQKVSDLTGMENLTNITGLQITNTDVADLTPIANLTALKDVTLTYDKITRIQPLSHLSNVKNMQLQGNQISDISPLKGLANLATINIYNNQVSDIQALANLKKVTTLDLGMNQIQHIEALANLDNLKSVQLNSNLVQDITPLQDAANLTILGLFSNNITDISPAGKIPTLTSLDFSRNRISDISSLKNLTKLTYLKANDNQITQADVVTAFPALTYLNLAENDLTDVTALQDLRQLQELNISENHLSNLEPLKNLTNLLNFYALDQRIELVTATLGTSSQILLKDRDGQKPDISLTKGYQFSGDSLIGNEIGEQQASWKNDQGDFSGCVTQEIQQVKQVFLDDFMLGDKYITGIYSNPDVTKMSVQVNQKIYYGGDVIGNKMRFYIEGKITKLSDVVTINTYNKKGEILEITTLKIRELPKDVAKWSNTNFLFIGDSITIGLRANVAFPTIVGKQLRLPAIQNAGISGASVAQNKETPMSFVQQLEALELSKTTDVVIFGGTNDFEHNTPLGNINSTDKNTFYGALNTMASKLKGQNKNIYFITPLWRARQGAGDGKDADSSTNELGLYLTDYGTAIKNVASKYDTPCLDLYSQKPMYQSLLTDGLHPNDEGQYFIGNSVATWLNSVSHY